MSESDVVERADRAFFTRDPLSLARRLLGQRLVRMRRGRRTCGIIVETEAYLGIPDRAAHTHGGRRTERNRSMWATGGHAYVYFIYGMHCCMNVVAGLAEEPVAVLIRALQPDEGTARMYRRRRAARRDVDLCSGPGKLCQALAIDRRLDGVDLVSSNRLFVELLRQRQLPTRSITVGPRVGVDYAGEWAAKPLRFTIAGNPNVSRSLAR
jgi:DNA-3-methyladenine glycosylase